MMLTWIFHVGSRFWSSEFAEKSTETCIGRLDRGELVFGSFQLILGSSH